MKTCTLAKKKQIVVTGIGPVTSMGLNIDDLWNNILEQNICITEERCSVDGELWERFFAHRIREFNINRFNINDNILKRINVWRGGARDLDLDYFLASVKLSLDDSRITYDAQYNDIGLVLAHENPGLNIFAEKAFNVSYDLLKKRNFSKKNFFQKVYTKCYKDVFDLQTFMYLFHVGSVFSLHGTSFFINNACSSGLYAIDLGSQLIQSGKCSAVIVSVVDRPDVYKYLWFKKKQMYAKDGIIKPFSEDADGFVFGEGGGAIVLEDYTHALKRKAKLYCEYLGGLFSFEGWKVTLPAVGKRYYQNMLRELLHRTGIKRSEIDLIVPHGVGAGIFDLYEANAFSEVFKKELNNILFSAFKPFIGHCLGASGMVETIMLILSLRNSTVLPLLNCKKLNKKISLKFPFKLENKHIRYALKTSSAFAGYDAAILLANVKDK